MNKKLLIINLKSGLCNQLVCIVKCLILASNSNRNIYFNNFQIDYKNLDELIPIEYVINLDKLQYYSDKFNLDVKILKHIDKNINDKIIKIEKGDNNQDIYFIKNFIKLIEDNSEIEFLNIEAPISADIPKKYNKIFQNISINIPFSEKFIEYSNKIKSKFKLDYYLCIHLRLENDAIKHMIDLTKNNNFNKFNNIYKFVYEKELELIKHWNVRKYICTSLGLYDNINNEYYKSLKKEYNLIDKNDVIQELEFNLNGKSCRELYGILDFIVAKDSNYFIGCDWSSFSLLIYNNHVFKNKKTKLLNLWKSCIK